MRFKFGKKFSRLVIFLLSREEGNPPSPFYTTDPARPGSAPDHGTSGPGPQTALDYMCVCVFVYVSDSLGMWIDVRVFVCARILKYMHLFIYV